MQKIVFISGPVRGDGSKDIKKANIEIARKFVRIFIENKIPYYSPHLNIEQDVMDFGENENKFSWDMNAEFLNRSNAVAILPGWENSSGTKMEIENATKMGLPIFYLENDGAINEIVNWLNN